MSNYKPPYREWRASDDPEAFEKLTLIMQQMKEQKEREEAKRMIRGVVWCLAGVSLVMCFFIILHGLMKL